MNVKQQRIINIKADILQEIQTFSRKDQAKYYAQFGNMIWEHDQKEGDFWLGKAVEIGINPATEYKDEAERLSSYWNLLSNVLDENAVLSERLISKIKEIKIDETNLETLESANKTYIVIAHQILNRKEEANSADINLAFEFALLSLKGKKPAFSDFCVRILLHLKHKNENLSNIYFTKLLEAAKNTSNEGWFIAYLFEENFNYSLKSWRRDMPDSRVKVFLELMLPFIQRESEALISKKSDDCITAKGWGLKYLKDFKRLLPTKSPIVEKAIAVCQNAEIPHWKKPDFPKNSPKTSQDFLNLAKKITDKKIQTSYLRAAANLAIHEKTFTLSNEILDGFEKEFRDSNWVWSKVHTNSKWIEELFKTDNFDEIINVLNNSPREYRPFIIVGSLNSMYQLKSNQKEFVLDLMNQARADFNKINKFTEYPPNFATNPTIFGQLTMLYIRFGLYEEAITTHQETIISMNRILKTLSSEELNKNFFRYQSPQFYFIIQFPSTKIEIVNQYYGVIYENIGKIEHPRTRISERLFFLRRNFELMSRKN
ncbi:MAG TPA: hypothetical protein PKE69_08395 [Pyrinomonadaceae bacterium]|nr:hypothetical protein [Pyrinomonadaceae bacterium]